MVLVVALLGMAAALLFDLLRVWRLVTRPGRLWAHVADVAYVVLIGLLLAVGLMFLNWFQIRIFVVVGLLAGALLYFNLASPLVLRVLTGLFTFTLRITRSTARACSALGGRAAAATRTRARTVRGRVVSRAQRARRWGGGLAKRMATWWRRFPGFLV